MLARALALTLLASTLAAQSPANLKNEIVALVGDPGQIALSPYSMEGFATRTPNPQAPLDLYRFDRRTGVSAPFGDPIWDPDGIAIDVDGLHTGTAGTVLVAHHPNNLSLGQITAIDATGSATVLHGPVTDLANAGGLRVDAAGDVWVLAFPTSPTLIRISPAGTRTHVLTRANHFNYDFTPSGTILIVDGVTGEILEFSSTGAPLGLLGTVSGNYVASIAAGIGGPWSASAYIMDGPDLVALSGGTTNVLASGFLPTVGNSGGAIAFGPDGALYVSAYRAAQPDAIERFVYSGCTGHVNGTTGATLRMAGIGAGEAGPFVLSLRPGSLLTLDYDAPPGSTCWLMAGARAPVPANIPGIGTLELDITQPLALILDPGGPLGPFLVTGGGGNLSMSLQYPGLGADLDVQGFVFAPMTGWAFTSSFTLRDL